MVPLVLLAATVAGGGDGEQPAASDQPAGTIAFASLAPRDWDVYWRAPGGERRLTDHAALDYNAAFSPDGRKIAFVSQRDGNMELYAVGVDGSGLRRLTDNFALDDHPAWSPDGAKIAFASTREPAPAGRASNAIYVMNAEGGEARRISPVEASDYSPAWSPRGDLIAFASGSGRAGASDIYVMRPDGSGRRLVAGNGGWPTFIEGGAAIAFHSRREPERWDVWRVDLDGSNVARLATGASMPRANPAGSKLALVVHGKPHKQIAMLDVATGSLAEVTSEPTDHWNPSLAADGTVVYHKRTPETSTPNVELWGAPDGTRLNLLRLAGSFPAFSPDEKRLALAGGRFARVDVMNLDGSARKSIFEATPRSLFGMSWSHGVERVAFSHGVVFGDPKAGVNILAAAPERPEGAKKAEPLTADAGNNGFPSYAPDGQQMVFRSGRGGAKNLYIMDRDGRNVRRLTEGNWTDTMCDWSPKGDWIAFASDRGGEFEIWLVRPDGSGLKKLIGGGGRHNHPHFSPDAAWIVFTSQRAGYSAEEISLPSQPQPYGDLFLVRVDGSGLVRLTHNGFEEGTPAWGSPQKVVPSDEGQPSEADY
jgi:Tol biopolymer transport system component